MGRETKLEYLSFKQAVVRDRAQLAELAQQRMIMQAQLAERDPSQPLQ